MLREVYQILLESYGEQNWWPAETPFEVCVGVLLTQNTAWRNVEKAISNLKGHKLLTPEGILECQKELLEELIRPAGFYRQKAKYLKNFCSYLVSSGGLENLKRKKLENLRNELLKLKGIGKETADSILLYALEKPVFVVDAYTKRLFYRLGILKTEKENYEKVRRIVEASFSRESDKLKIFKEFHALIVEHCKATCRKKPLCNSCCLLKLCRYVKI
ncbi:endonuclease III domain-containing protein [Phorcysia thermohydrogeniphila]|uniref:DNA-3-methyladenine glycosylase III n=1 Tax=Phorcysia thermohydrogeniphila TaxID=936138 RepID=A0A4R1G746_9BACT|nr:endonuclease III domain-containing protein [Phorcysia thermohydrogeniphila]TCK03867.1 DNA-3-methyladenine glycosylase III [Phorcysia thermohydrogeniphila]